jgi:LmbE family N-acetylglucosaminyl deacetylase
MKELKTTVKRRLKTTPSIGILLLSIILFQNITIAQNTNSGKTLLAVFAHPDDEGTIAPLMVKYVEQGVKVHLVVCTDGRYGTNENTDYEAGDDLAAMRREEMQCSADNLGVELTHLRYHDQLKSGEGYDGHIPHVRSLIKDIYDIVEKIQPDAIITFGPEGWSNHMDHRLVGATVTQVFLSKVWNKKINLYYVGMPSDVLDDSEQKIIRGQDRSYLTTKVTYTDEHREQSFQAIFCHKSQFGEMGLDKIRKWSSKREKAVYLRKFVAPTETEDSVFN